jgi:NAD+ synthase
MPIPVKRADLDLSWPLKMLDTDPVLLERYLVEFLRDEVVRRRKMSKAVVGLSGGVDSAVTTYLAAKAFGPENVHVIRMPYKISSSASLDHAQLAIDDLGLPAQTIEITGMVDGYVQQTDPEMSGHRIGNICARCRMTILYDQGAKLGAIPLGTGNKTERYFGYYTWHGDDAPPINPLGDLFKTQVWELARHLGVPSEIVDKAPTADLVAGQTDEGDFGISYHKADQILVMHTSGYPDAKIASFGFTEAEIAIVKKRVAGTHWKRKLATVAMISDTAINEFYLRPVDY